MSIIFDKIVRFVNPRTGKMEIGEIISSNSKTIMIESNNKISVIPMNYVNRYDSPKSFRGKVFIHSSA